MMSGIFGSMMMGLGGFMTTMFSGFFGGFLWPIWMMMTGWFGL